MIMNFPSLAALKYSLSITVLRPYVLTEVERRYTLMSTQGVFNFSPICLQLGIALHLSPKKSKQRVE